ncbi:hypothetical protein HII36_46795, partial [Nonomuraea sp. NN258]|uniref:hypothetical protein n=1 Tax=Nonomuraea antri TaxID=2730852 RepID=UPI001568CFFC
ATTAATTAEPAYRVEVVNHSGFGLDEVTLAYVTRGDPTPRIISRRLVPSGATAAFDPVACSDLRRFAVSAFIGRREVLHTADLTPDPDCYTQIELTRN